ncbi:MAG: cytidylate kinase family protein [Candidatus Aenigmarchaeota archaeon]|nr:cytidylate kinase family protein [Candidatus Aenigmarchaeota archaeon]
MTKTFLPFLENHERLMENRIKKKGLTITISGLSGIGKSTVAEAVAKDLSLEKIVMGEIFRSIAKERSMELEKFSATREDEIDYQIEKKSLELSMRGGVVIDARMSGMVAGNHADCRIMLDCDMETKSERVAKREKISVTEARQKLDARDTSDSAKYMKLYGTDGSDPSFYDAIIDTTNMDIETSKKETVKIVKQILKDKNLV